MSFLNLPVIPTFRDIANLLECMAMFYFIKGLSVFRIVAEPCADRFLLLDGLTVARYAFEKLVANRKRQHRKDSRTLMADLG